jgi:peptidoglycan hydrolase-like protein with peptidoglycan-binding domain
VVRWGEDYSGTIDGMHFEINDDAAAVHLVAERLRAAGGPVNLLGHESVDPPAPVAPAAAQGRAPAPLPVLRKGDSGGWVVLLQRCLGVAADGEFGDLTERALVERQRINVLDPDGVAGAKTWSLGILRPFGVLRNGSSGLGVEVLQNYLGLRPGAGLDGEFGDETERGVRAVQTWGHIAADGIVGPATYDVLTRV